MSISAVLIVKNEAHHLRECLETLTWADEIVVLGAHHDSINQSWGETRAPGADDNASGSSNLFEALRILASQGRAARTIEFFWYAGEESGLLGSAEIARDYAARKKNVVGVLQLDMTLFPGDGEFVLGSMTDFTSPALRAWFAELNKTYMGKVQRITDFGAFVEIMPGTDGLLHVSEIATHRVKDVRDELKEGQQLLVKVINIDPTGKIRLSRKALLQDEAPKA